VLFLPMSWPTHVFPMVPLAWAFRSAGHEVRVAGQPVTVDAIETSGLPAFVVGASYDFTAATTDLSRHEHRAGRTLSVDGVRALPEDERRRFLERRAAPHVRMAEAMADELVTFGRAWRPDVVITDPALLAAPLAAHAAQAPLIRHLAGLDLTWQAAHPRIGGPGGVFPDGLSRLFDRYGVSLGDDFTALAAGTIDPCPPSLQFPGVPSRIPERYVPYNGAGVLPAWLVAPPARRRLCVCWGTLTTQLLGADGFLVPDVLKAVCGLDVEVVVTVKRADRELLDGFPEVRVVQELPLDLLLPRCSAVVHQGGFGTMMTAAFHGVPQVIVARIGDQTINAQRLAGTGAGVYAGPDESDVEGLRAAVCTALEPGSAVAAGQLRDEIRFQPTPAEVVSAVQSLVGGA